MTRGVWCSTLAREAREPLAASASHASGCLLISYPKRRWGRAALGSAGLPGSLVDACAELGETHAIATRFVAHEGDWRDEVDLWRFPEGRARRSVPLAEVAGVLAHEDLRGWEPVDRPLVLVCTHGIRDRCCAMFGGQLVRALHGAARASEVEVREATHLGGDRFAPTVLVLPSGRMYGHLEPSDADALVDAALGAPALASRFRGSLFRPPVEQLVEGLATDLASARGEARIPEIERLETDDAGDRVVVRARLRLAATHLDVVVRARSEKRLVIGDCRHAETSERGSVTMWRIDEREVRDAALP